MTKIYKFIFWIAIIFIGLCLISPIIREIFGLEFANDTVKSNYKEFLFYALPGAILLTLFGTLKSNERKALVWNKIIATIVITFGVIFFNYISILGDMCIWTDEQILFKHKNDPNTKIIVREFGCGATDSGPPGVHIFKVKYYSKYFIRATKIDTSNIDKNEWINIE